jgi:hypothetical protein
VRVGLALGLALCAALVVAPAAGARERFCSPTGDFCTSTARIKGAVHLRVGTFSFQGRVRICVTDPRARRTCRSWPLRETQAESFWEAKVRWFRNYPSVGPGLYRVRFLLGTTRLGPDLDFRVR